MISLAQNFIPAAADWPTLMRKQDPEGDFFRRFSEEHRKREGTGQGMYAVTPSGDLLDSVFVTCHPANNREKHASLVAAMLRRAFAKWTTAPPEHNSYPRDIRADSAMVKQPQAPPPGGLVLRGTARDLQQPGGAPPERHLYQRDYLRLNEEEARQWLPARLEMGSTIEVPPGLVQRLARFHLTDRIVGGGTPPYAPEHVHVAQMSGRVIRVQGSQVVIQYQGETKTLHEGEWRTDGHPWSKEPRKMNQRGVECRLWAEVRYDQTTERFLAFEMIALAVRWGATEWNYRVAQQAPSTAGFYYTLADSSERLPPVY